MKGALCFILLFTYQITFGQTVNFSFQSFQNEYELYLQKEENNQFYFFITDKKNNKSQKLVLKTNITLSKFIDEVNSAARKVSSNFYLTTRNSAVQLEIPKEKLVAKEYDSLDLSEENWILLLKSQTLYSQRNEEFEEYIKDLDDVESAVLLEDPIKIQVLKTEGKFTFAEDGTEELTFSSEEDFLKLVLEEYKKDLMPLIISQEEFLAVKELDLKIWDELILEEYLEKIKKAGSGVLLDNISLTDDGSSSTEFLAVEILSDGKNESFALKFCNKNFNCITSQSMKFGILESVFNNIIQAMEMNELTENDGKISNPELSSLYIKARDYNERRKISVATKPFRDSISDLYNQIENAKVGYSGSLRLNHKLDLYESEDTGESKWLFFKKYKPVPLENEAYFLTEYVTVRFFNNKAKEVVVVGKIKGMDSIDPEKEFVVVNNQYSLPLRSFNSSHHFVPISSSPSDALCLQLNYNDIFQYTPFESSFNYSPRDKEYRLDTNDTIKIEQRKLMDYFTAVLFSDFLGLNSKNSNALLQAEARIKIPLHNYNFARFSIFHSLGADLNATLYNGFEDTHKFITPVSSIPSADGNSLSSVTVNTFDYIKHNNLNTGINLNIFNWEIKNASTEWNILGYGFRYYRTGLRHVFPIQGTDEIVTYQLNAITHEFFTNFEIRPQLNFGADFNAAINWLNPRGSLENVGVILNPANNNNQKTVLRIQLNLYSKTNPDYSHSGIYGRLGGFYHIGAKDFYPQILVGYATNLSSFVNKFQED